MNIWYGVSHWHEGWHWFMRALDLEINQLRDFKIADIIGGWRND
jgi:hypothetical protein